MRSLLACLAVVAFLCGCIVAAASEHMEVEIGEYRLDAALFRPPGTGPFPAVVALHGCDGLFGQGGAIRPHLAEWGRVLAGKGFVVLFPDSFGSRGLGSQCRVRARSVQPYRERVADANAARTWLQGQDWVKKDRVGLIGWSNGAIAALWAVRPQAQLDDDLPDFRSVAALYPGCRRLGEAAWSTRIPAMILLGAADDWTPARDCEQMVAGARGRSARTVVIAYRGAHHQFDHADLPLQSRRGLAFTADGSGRAHVGGNAQARADALTRVPRWLAR